MLFSNIHWKKILKNPYKEHGKEEDQKKAKT